MPSLPHVTRIVALTDESATVRTFRLGVRLDACPGQFVMAWLPGRDEKPFSLVSADPVRLTIARVGPFTTALHALQPGDRLWVRGPLGNGFTLPSFAPVLESRQGRIHEQGLRPAILLVGGGYGVAPLRFLAQAAIAGGWRVDVVVGARTASEVIFVDRFAALGARVEVTTDDGSQGWRGLATDAAAALLDVERYRSLYACGPEPMLVAVKELGRRWGLPAQISYERRMRCGFGVCGTCHRDGWLVCRDGPVFMCDQSHTPEEE